MSLLFSKYSLVKSKTTGVDPVVDSILSGEGVEAALFPKVAAIFNSPIKKGYVEACLIASRDFDLISEIIEVPVEVLVLYKSLCFNIQDFDKLSLLEIVDEADSPSEKSMKLWALSQGLDFVSWRLGKNVNLNPVEGLQELFTLSVFKSKEALFSSNAAESSKEATKWTKLSMDLARLLKVWVMDSGLAKKDIELALESIDPEFKGFDALD